MPRLPAVVTELQKTIQGPDSDIKKIVKILKYEPLIAADLLRIANLARPGNAIKTIEHAVVFVGRKALGDLIVTAGLKSFPVSTSDFSIEHFWLESFLTGMIGETIARQLAKGDLVDQIYLACTLCNVGVLVGGLWVPEIIDKVYANTESMRVPWKNAEFMLSSPKHEVLGEIGCVFWALPTWVLRAAIGHHGMADQEASLEEKEIVAIATFANQAKHWILKQEHRIDERLMQTSFQNLRLQKDMDSTLRGFQPLKGEAERTLTRPMAVH